MTAMWRYRNNVHYNTYIVYT